MPDFDFQKFKKSIHKNINTCITFTSLTCTETTCNKNLYIHVNHDWSIVQYVQKSLVNKTKLIWAPT